MLACDTPSPPLERSTERAHVLTRCMSDSQDTEQRTASTGITRQTSEDTCWLDVQRRARALASPQTPFEARVSATPFFKAVLCSFQPSTFPPAPLRFPNLSVTEKAACVAVDYFTNF